MRKKIFCLLLFLSASAQAASQYYVFGSAEDDCVIDKMKVEGEACLCIQVNAWADKRAWAIDWSGPDCKLLKTESPHTSIDCQGGGCTQHECLEVVYDTQHGDSQAVSEEVCAKNHLPMIDF